MNIKTKASRVGNTSLAALGERIISTVGKSGIDEAKNSKQYVVLEEVNNRYQQAIMPHDAKQVTEKINALYNNRNELFLDMYEYVKGLTKSPAPDAKLAAIKVFSILNRYGRVLTNVKIADLSVRYIRIIEGLRRPDVAPAVNKVILTAKVAEFEQLQLDYEDLYMGRGNDSTVRVAPSTLRKEMENAVKLYVEELKWMANGADTEAWHTLYRNVEQRFNEVNVTATRKKAETPTDTTNSTGTTETKAP